MVVGKGYCIQNAPNQDGRVLMYKKSIFWHLTYSYSKVLDTRHAIDDMHPIKNICVNLLGFLGTYGKGKDTLESWEDLKSYETTRGSAPKIEG